MKSVKYEVEYQVHGQTMERIWRKVRSIVIRKVSIQVREEIYNKIPTNLKSLKGLS